MHTTIVVFRKFILRRRRTAGTASRRVVLRHRRHVNFSLSAPGETLPLRPNESLPPIHSRFCRSPSFLPYLSPAFSRLSPAVTPLVRASFPSSVLPESLSHLVLSRGATVFATTVSRLGLPLPPIPNSRARFLSLGLFSVIVSIHLSHLPPSLLTFFTLSPSDFSNTIAYPSIKYSCSVTSLSLSLSPTRPFSVRPSLRPFIPSLTGISLILFSLRRAFPPATRASTSLFRIFHPSPVHLSRVSSLSYVRCPSTSPLLFFQRRRDSS